MKAMTAHLPVKRLAGFYFGYYAAIGALVPYLSLYLHARGLSPAQIGSVVGMLAVTRIFAPYLWGMAADASGRRMRVVRLTLGGALLCFLALTSVSGFAALCLVIFLYGLFANGTMAQFEVVTFAHLAAQSHGYSRIRVWGSIGFVVLVLGLGPVLEWLGIQTLPYWIAALFAGAWLVALRIPDAMVSTAAAQPTPSAWSVARQQPVLALLLACLLAQISFGPYYGFYSLYLEQHGYRKDVIGLLWALGVIAEVVVFWLIPRWLPRLSLRWLFVASQLVTVLRWLVTPLVVGSLVASAGVQLLHAISFGVYHLAAVTLIQRQFPQALQGRGQAIYIGMSYGVGGALGGWGAGQLWSRIDPDLIWVIAAAVAGLAACIAHTGLARDKPGGMMTVSP